MTVASVPVERSPEQWLEEVARRSNLPPRAAAAVLEPQRKRVVDMRAAGLSSAEIVAELGQPTEVAQALQAGWVELQRLQRRLWWPHWSITLVTAAFAFSLWIVWEISDSALHLYGYLLTCSGVILVGLYVAQRRVKKAKYLWQKLAQQRGMSHMLLTACIFAGQMWMDDVSLFSLASFMLGVVFLTFLFVISNPQALHAKKWQESGVDVDQLLFVNLERNTPCPCPASARLKCGLCWGASPRARKPRTFTTWPFTSYHA